MATAHALTLLKRLKKALGNVTVPEDDDLGLLEINLTHLRDIVHPATEESVASLLPTETGSAGRVIQHHLRIAERVLGAETLSHPGVAEVQGLMHELARECEAMTGSGTTASGTENAEDPTLPFARGTSATTAIPAGDRPTMADVLTTYVLKGRRNELPATMATDARS